MSPLALQLIAENKRTKSTYLDLGNCGLTDLPAALFECVWLETLILSNVWKEYENGNWTEKKSVNAGEVNVLSFLPSGFAKLTKLKKLVCAGEDSSWIISDLSPLAGLVNLRSLDLYCNEVSDLSALSGLVHLDSLYLERNEISDLSALSGLVNLTGLYLFWNEISDLSALSGLVNLDRLDLSANHVSDLFALSGLVNLTELYLSSNQLTTIPSEFCRQLSSLKKLSLSDNPFISIPEEITNQYNCLEDLKNYLRNTENHNI